MKNVKLSLVKQGLKLKMGNGRVKRTIKLPLAESIILGFGLVEGFMLGGFTGGLIGLALGGVALITCFLSVIPFVGQFLYHIIMSYVFGVAHFQLTNMYLVGFIYSLLVSWMTIKAIVKLLNKKVNADLKAKKQQ